MTCELLFINIKLAESHAMLDCLACCCFVKSLVSKGKADEDPQEESHVSTRQRSADSTFHPRVNDTRQR